MKVLLLNCNSSRSARQGQDATPAPLGLMFLGAVLRRRGHHVRILQVRSHVLAQDEESLPLVQAELAGQFREFGPDLVGLSLRNLGAARKPANPFRLLEYFSVHYEARLVRAIRMIWDGPVVLGGSAFSIEPALYMKVAKADYGIVGEAEESLPLLAEALERGESPEAIPGLIRGPEEADGGLRRRALVHDLAGIGPAAADLVEDFRDLYCAHGGYAPIQTKRGCAMNCIYCTTPEIEGAPYRQRPLAHVVEEMTAYRDALGVRHFYVVDATLNHPMSSALAFCEAIRSAHLEVEWVASLNPGYVREDVIQAMAGAGCIGVTLGLESCSDRVLRAYGKGFDTAQIRHTVNLLRKHGIPFDCSMILGGPGDSPETFRETLDFCTEHLRDEVVRFHDGMTITRCTPSYDRAVREGYIDPSLPFEDLLLANDFRRVKAYTYYFPQVVKERGAFLASVQKACASGRWIFNGSDFLPDPATGDYMLSADFSMDREQRPWWTSLQRRSAETPA